MLINSNRYQGFGADAGTTRTVTGIPVLDTILGGVGAGLATIFNPQPQVSPYTMQMQQAQMQQQMVQRKKIPTWVWIAGGAAGVALLGTMGVVAFRR